MTAAAAATPCAAATRSTTASSSEPLGLETSRSAGPAIVSTARRNEASTDSLRSATATNVVTPSPTPAMVRQERSQWARRWGRLTRRRSARRSFARTPGPLTRRAVAPRDRPSPPLARTGPPGARTTRRPRRRASHPHEIRQEPETVPPLAALRLVAPLPARAERGVAEALWAEDSQRGRQRDPVRHDQGWIDVAHQARSARDHRPMDPRIRVMDSVKALVVDEEVHPVVHVVDRCVHTLAKRRSVREPGEEADVGRDNRERQEVEQQHPLWIDPPVDDEDRQHRRAVDDVLSAKLAPPLARIAREQAADRGSVRHVGIAQPVPYRGECALLSVRRRRIPLAVVVAVVQVDVRVEHDRVRETAGQR